MTHTVAGDEDDYRSTPWKDEVTRTTRVEEFCFITYTTYTKSEVLKMESQVLNILNFHPSPPTTEAFFGRFIRATQASHQVNILYLLVIWVNSVSSHA
ncbi:cyclin-A2-1-like [Helianthus annuus]|uniref:cyclin-A2-1-like n=1 Tax=Helianthus annuus TaxID=4232 RepID=UPI00165311C2|nr:cyclin-A2-1-like [Helianthus annuus]